MKRKTRGEVARVWVPARLGYGVHGAEPLIPPNTDLVFELTLVEIRNDFGIQQQSQAHQQQQQEVDDDDDDMEEEEEIDDDDDEDDEEENELTTNNLNTLNNINDNFDDDDDDGPYSENPQNSFQVL